MVELIKGKLTGGPQWSTAGGLSGLLYQLSQVLSDIQVGQFLSTLSGMTYGSIIGAYSPFIIFIALILFDEDKIKELIGR